MIYYCISNFQGFLPKISLVKGKSSGNRLINPSKALKACHKSHCVRPPPLAQSQIHGNFAILPRDKFRTTQVAKIQGGSIEPYVNALDGIVTQSAPIFFNL